MAPNRGQKGKIDKNSKNIAKVTTTSISDDNLAKKAKKELQNIGGDQLCKSDAKSPAKDVPEIASQKVKSQSHDRKSVPNSSNSKSEKPFGCSYCKKRFALAITAQDHEIIHMKDNLGLKKSPEDTAAKGHEKKAKTSEQKLKSRSHDRKSVPDSSNSKSEKQFGCRYCKKRFALATTAQIHERTHTGEKPFSCNLCDYKSTNSSHLSRHLKGHHDLNKSPEDTVPKGQLISKGLFVFFNLQENEQNFWQNLTFSSLFFGRIEDITISF